MRRMATIAAVLLMSLGAWAGAWAQNAPTAVQANSVYVGADGKFEAAPDTAVVQFNIAAQETELKAAYERAQKAAEEVREALRSNGLDPKQAEIGGFQVQPVYDYRTAKRKLVGYRVNSSISLKVRDFSKIGPLAARFAEMDVTENQSISYDLQEIEAAKSKAVEDAFQKAKLSATTLAKAAGRTLGELSYASVDTFTPPPMMVRNGNPMMAMKAAGAEMAGPTEEFAAQKVTVTAHVNALFNMK